jgi:hypothetical protein
MWVRRRTKRSEVMEQAIGALEAAEQKPLPIWKRYGSDSGEIDTELDS